MARQVPTTLRASVWLLWGMVLWSAITALLVVIYRDQLETAWAYGNEAALEKFRQGGLEMLRSSNIDIPDFGSVAVTASVTFALIVMVLAAFLRGGHPWARWAITVMIVFAAFFSVLMMDRRVPDLFIWLAAGSMVFYVAQMVAMWHPATSRFLRESATPPEVEADSDTPA